ncbi:hypothetical protein QN362_15635 [Actimicrobium sp. CCC2.4]|uniref:hypothetical protein n=1 Tax=Actimicrobium sp. CCC2.4 TaxID=3048606 RepID=UPI002AC9D4E9|nr:hypothetical protein [Actimicrobium sp. CCC2.4]MEB0136769.1 hypothetical protein [Actimicrobium sp. CCC2.4]WPX33951.1 hypothetical protein RHM62_09140 [Actimicrobium sp. CCC2.4]
MFSSISLRPWMARTANVKTITVLVMALLFAQWLGQMHRVAHDGSATASAKISPEVASGTSSVFQLVAHLGDSSHSCAAFDAATLSAGICTAAIAIPVLPNLHALALWIAFASRLPPFTAHFLSRAPPAV